MVASILFLYFSFAVVVFFATTLIILRSNHNNSNNRSWACNNRNKTRSLKIRLVDLVSLSSNSSSNKIHSFERGRPKPITQVKRRLFNDKAHLQQSLCFELCKLEFEYRIRIFFHRQMCVFFFFLWRATKPHAATKKQAQ